MKNNDDRIEHDLFSKLSFFPFVVLGLGFSVIVLLDNRSLWLDELSLAMNFRERNFTELLTPLSHQQSAPILFLFIENAFFILLGETDWSLRVAPFLFFLGGVFFLYKILIDLKINKNVIYFSLSIFLLSSNLIRYSSEVKQYSNDLFWGCLLVFQALRTFKHNKNSFPLILTGTISIWFSNIAIFMLTSIGVQMLLELYHNPTRLNIKTTVLSVIFFGTSFLTYYINFIHNHPLHDYMVSYWSNAHAFFDQKDILSSSFWIALNHKFSILFYALHKKSIVIYIISLLIYIYGYIYLYKQEKEKVILFIMPLIIHLTLSYLEIYPFASRLILYLLPLVIVPIAFGIQQLSKFSTLKNYGLLNLLLLIPIVVSTQTAIRHCMPLEKAETKQVLSYINDRINKEESLYVYFATKNAYAFYKNKYPAINTPSSKVIYDYSWNLSQDEISALPAKSFWAIFSHTKKYPKDKFDTYGENDIDFLIKNLRYRGFELIDKYNVTGAACCRFEYVGPHN